jgi:hypothetical protein
MAIELRNHLIRVADLVVRRGRPHDTSRNRKWRIEPAESETQRMYANSLHGNREIPEATVRNPTDGPVGEGQRPTTRHARDWEVGRRHSIDETNTKVHNQTTAPKCPL